MSDGPPAEPKETARDGVASGLTDGLAVALSAVVTAVLAILSQRVILKWTGERDFSRYGSFLVVANSFAVVFMSWPAWSVLRLGAEEFGERKRLGRTLGLHLALFLASVLVCAPVGWLLRDRIVGFVREDLARQAIAYSALNALGIVLAAHLKPAGRVALFASLTAVTRLLYLVLVFKWRRPLTATELANVCLLTTIPQVLIPLVFLAKDAGRPQLPRKGDLGRATGFGLRVLARNLGMALLQNVNFLVIHLVVSEADRDESLSEYLVAASLAEQTAVLAVGVEHLVGPILARAAARGEERTLATYYRVLAPQVVLAWGIAIGVGVLVARPVLVLLRAHDPDSSALVLQVLFLATAVRIVSTLEAPVLDAHLESRAPLIAFGVRLLLNTALAFFLVPRLGITGAGLATVVAYCAGGLVQSTYVARRFGLPALRLYLWCFPAFAAFAWTRALDPDVLRDSIAAVGLVVASLVLARAGGVFSPETLQALAGVRMPARLRGWLERLYGVAPG